VVRQAVPEPVEGHQPSLSKPERPIVPFDRLRARFSACVEVFCCLEAFDAALGPEGPALLDIPPGRGRPWTLASVA
jgi:hypothetical protein